VLSAEEIEKSFQVTSNFEEVVIVEGCQRSKWKVLG
jgi:hypothetical protein